MSCNKKNYLEDSTLHSIYNRLLYLSKELSSRQFHCSLHTFATLILTAGSDINTTSEMLGHTNIHTTEIYTDVVMEKKVDAVNMLNGIF